MVSMDMIHVFLDLGWVETGVLVDPVSAGWELDHGSTVASDISCWEVTNMADIVHFAAIWLCLITPNSRGWPSFKNEDCNFEGYYFLWWLFFLWCPRGVPNIWTNPWEFGAWVSDGRWYGGHVRAMPDVGDPGLGREEKISGAPWFSYGFPLVSSIPCARCEKCPAGTASKLTGSSEPWTASIF